MNRKQHKKPFIIIIHGPTGVGKTDLSLGIAAGISAEIINMDTGQFYTALSVGTAKPDWKNDPIKHHFFDIIDSPGSMTVARYRTILLKKIDDITSRGAVPIIVGGSSFYLYSLLFPVEESLPSNGKECVVGNRDNSSDWERLYQIDPTRALSIEKSDTYRIARSLEIWDSSGTKPSELSFNYKPCADFLLLYITRDLHDLRDMISRRVLFMLKNGWIEECQNLLGTQWYYFLRHKKFIGYNEIFDYLEQSNTNEKNFIDLTRIINNKTNQYAKRQRTFWRKIEREIVSQQLHNGSYVGCIESINLTKTPIRLYINQLLSRLRDGTKKNE